MEHSRAAQIWSLLEAALIERCGLPDGRMLEVNRPYLIRAIGDALTIEPVDTELPVAAHPATLRPVGPGTGGRMPGRTLKLDDSAPVCARVVGKVDKIALKDTLDMAVANLPAEWVRSSAEVRHLREQMALNRRIDEALEAMLQKSCSRRTGYDGDDGVGY